jgi:hypothetical protein
MNSASDETPSAGHWHLVARDDEAVGWSNIAIFGFWFRHPRALDAKFPGRPVGMEAEADAFRRLGVELLLLEWDLAWCLNEFKTAYQVLYSENLSLKKFSVVYHVDNFNVRVHKLRENVYRLLALTVGLDHCGKPRREDSAREKEVETGLHRLGLSGAVQILQRFENHPRVKRAIDDRHLFVHQFRQEPNWPMIGPERRYEDESDDATARELRGLTEGPELDRYADKKANQLLDTLVVIQGFRDELWSFLLDETTRIVSKRPEETRQRLQPVIDFLDFCRGRGPLWARDV